MDLWIFFFYLKTFFFPPIRETIYTQNLIYVAQSSIYYTQIWQNFNMSTPMSI